MAPVSGAIFSDVGRPGLLENPGNWRQCVALVSYGQLQLQYTVRSQYGHGLVFGNVDLAGTMATLVLRFSQSFVCDW